MLFLRNLSGIFTCYNRIFTKQPTMTREILTLIVNETPTEYFVDFEQDRKQFTLHPAQSTNSAPSFRIIERYGELIELEEIDPDIIQQAKKKLREIMKDPNQGRS